MVAKNIKYVIRWLLKIKNSELGYFVIESPLSKKRVLTIKTLLRALKKQPQAVTTRLAAVF